MARTINILIVEDEPAIAELLAMNLRRLGHCPLLASSAEKALQLIRDILPDLVLIDRRLPSRSCLALMHELRQGARTRDIPLILLLASGEEPGTLAGFESGADDTITKPFSPRELLSHIHTALHRRLRQPKERAVRAGGLAVAPATQRVTFGRGSGEQEIRLRPAEFKLLHYMMSHPDRVHSRSALLGKVWATPHSSRNARWTCTSSVCARPWRRCSVPSWWKPCVASVTGSPRGRCRQINDGNVSSARNLAVAK